MKDRVVKMGIQYFGCARFDTDNPGTGGWASVEGGEAYRISSVGNLGSDTMWWTNLSFRSIHEANIQKLSFIKRTTYLNTWVPDGQNDICLNWGLLSRYYSEQLITQKLSAMFNRTMRFVEEHYNLNCENLDKN
jgi:hypothetical protein